VANTWSEEGRGDEVEQGKEQKERKKERKNTHTCTRRHRRHAVSPATGCFPRSEGITRILRVF
jgi:hypothetical protein